MAGSRVQPSDPGMTPRSGRHALLRRWAIHNNVEFWWSHLFILHDLSSKAVTAGAGHRGGGSKPQGSRWSKYSTPSTSSGLQAQHQSSGWSSCGMTSPMHPATTPSHYSINCGHTNPLGRLVLTSKPLYYCSFPRDPLSSSLSVGSSFLFLGLHSNNTSQKKTSLTTS